MAHAIDYDDTHIGGAGHPGGPCWSTALALAAQYGNREKEALIGFVTGFEVMAKLGGGGLPGAGRSIQRMGFHPTAVFGRMGAAAVACVMMNLDQVRVAHAMGIAATTAGGLVASFGTHSKPFHAGKAAMDGILAAQLSSKNFQAATHLFELKNGLLDALVQNGAVEVPPLDFDSQWELPKNGFKPFACCRGTQASTQAARTLASLVARKKIIKVEAKIHPTVMVTAGKIHPSTPLEAKFSLPFCIAMGLRGYRMIGSDFNDAVMQDSAVREIVPIIELKVIQNQPPHSAHLDVYTEDGEHFHADTDIVLGHPDNPMKWDDLHAKFQGLVEPVLGATKTGALYKTLYHFEQPGSLQKTMELVSR
jgi:2-methylcitrate dehydratase PrpD